MMKPNGIDEYIASFPKDIQKKPEDMRSAIKKAAPGAEEAISYGMPESCWPGFQPIRNTLAFIRKLQE